MLRTKLKVFVLLLMAVSMMGLTRIVSACDIQHCQPIYQGHNPIGYGCIQGGGLIECWADVNGCTIAYCT